MAIDPRSRRRRSEGGRAAPRGRAASTSPRREGQRHPAASRPASPAKDDRSPGLHPGAATPSIGPGRRESGTRGEWADLLGRVTEAWGRGEPIPIDDHVARAGPGDAVDLIYHEFCLAEASGGRPDPAEYLARFPDHAEVLGRLLELHDALSVASLRSLVQPESGLPDSGDDVGPYRLLREMGRGAFARVFLAEQADLGDRLVVVKVSTRPSSEPTLLGRARHPHIVEVLRHIDDPESGLHLVCLPFLGGATLGAVLDVRRHHEGSGRSGWRRRPRSGRDLLADLDRASAPEYPTTDRPRPARAELARLSHPEAVAWVVARLAEALDHAWRRGVTHGDLKPSNILLTADGVPMLFDFNLASDGRIEAEAGPDPGGTPAYMAPERLRALAESARPDGDSTLARPRRSARLRASERHRADLYALGLVLAEALTGEPPATPARRSDILPEFAADLARLRAAPGHARSVARSGRIPSALRAILARCLALDPSDRYAHGGELAEDLDRWRADRPLVFAPEPRRSTWTRRLRTVRYPLVAVGLVLLVAAVVGAVAWSVLEGTQRDQALAKWAYILDRTEGVFPARGRRDEQRQAFVDTGESANRHLAHYQVASDPDWRDRPDVRALPEPERGELEAWVLEQVLRRAISYAARPDSPQDWRRALALVEIEAERTPYAALARQRAVLRERLESDPSGIPPRNGRVASASIPEPWLEAYLLGVQAESLHARQALGHYQDALAARPHLFWGHYRAALAALRLGEHHLAADSLRICVARRPENPALRNLLASVIVDLERNSPLKALPINLDEAQAECRRALAIDPDHLPATHTQTILHQLLGQTDSVHTNFERFKTLTRLTEPAASSLLGSRLLRLQDSPQSTTTSAGLDELALRKVLAIDPSNWTGRTELANRLVRLGRLAEATQAYQELIDENPNDLYAHYQHAFCLLKTGRDGSLEEFLMLANHPHLEEFLRSCTVGFRVFTAAAGGLLAQDELAKAEEMIRRGWAAIDSTPTCRPEMIAIRNPGEPIFPQAEMHYRAAQIDARAARAEPSRLASAVKHLRAAFAASPIFRNEWFPTDPYFAASKSLLLEQIDASPLVL